MKTTRINTTIIATVFSLFILSCQRDAHKEMAQPVSTEQMTTDGADRKPAPSGDCNPNAYTITLESHAFNGTGWDWIWSVQNPNPGNGNNGTSQDLSHWGMRLGTCLSDLSHVTGAAYSADGTDWTTFTPSYGTDPSQGCMTTPVLKFDAGTTGSNKTYYRLTVDQFYPVSNSLGYYKSGGNTGCCTFLFAGIGCSNSEEEERPVE
jgi:hypothetical protein